MIRFETGCGSVQALATYGPFNLVSIAEPSDAAPIDGELFVQVFQFLRSEVLSVHVHFMKKHRLRIFVFDWMKELLLFQVDADFRVVVDLSGLDRVVQEVLELVV